MVKGLEKAIGRLQGTVESLHETIISVENKQDIINGRVTEQEKSDIETKAVIKHIAQRQDRLENKFLYPLLIGIGTVVLASILKQLL